MHARHDALDVLIDLLKDREPDAAMMRMFTTT